MEISNKLAVCCSFCDNTAEVELESISLILSEVQDREMGVEKVYEVETSMRCPKCNKLWNVIRIHEYPEQCINHVIAE